MGLTDPIRAQRDDVLSALDELCAGQTEDQQIAAYPPPTAIDAQQACRLPTNRHLSAKRQSGDNGAVRSVASVRSCPPQVVLYPHGPLVGVFVAIDVGQG